MVKRNGRKGSSSALSRSPKAGNCSVKHEKQGRETEEIFAAKQARIAVAVAVLNENTNLGLEVR